MCDKCRVHVEAGRRDQSINQVAGCCCCCCCWAQKYRWVSFCFFCADETPTVSFVFSSFSPPHLSLNLLHLPLPLSFASCFRPAHSSPRFVYALYNKLCCLAVHVVVVLSVFLFLHHRRVSAGRISERFSPACVCSVFLLFRRRSTLTGQSFHNMEEMGIAVTPTACYSLLL